jgi:hypothetical protein
MLILLWGGVCAKASESAIIVSTIPATPTSDGEAIGNPPNASLQQAVRFVPNANYRLDSIAFDLVQSFGRGLIVAQIYSERGGLPDALLYSMTAPAPAPTSGGLFRISSRSPCLLQRGTAYWLTATNTDPASGSYWRYSDQSGWRAAVDLPGHTESGFPVWGNANGGGPAGPGTSKAQLLALEISGTAEPEPAGGEIIVSTIPAKQTCCGEPIGNPPGAKLQQAVRFVPNANYRLDSITFDLVQSFGSGRIVAQIYSERGGLPDALLYSITAPAPAPASGGLFRISSEGQFPLQRGTAYWLTATNTDPASGSNWWYSDQSGWRAAVDLPGHTESGFPVWGNADGGGPAGPGTTQALVLAFEISGTAEPEPRKR